MKQIEYTSFSECGGRKNNEDYCQVVANPDDERYLFVVCDGMGGHENGEIASQLISTTICDYWRTHSAGSETDMILKEAFRKASEALDAKTEELDYVMMGTTMVLAAIVGNQLTIAHCGDSRCYLLRPNEGVVYETTDHVQNSGGRNLITRCFFSFHRRHAEVDIRHFEFQIGDRLFLCTDGVSSYVNPDILRESLMENKSTEELADIVKLLCEQSYSPDNYSGILCKFGMQ